MMVRLLAYIKDWLFLWNYTVYNILQINLITSHRACGYSAKASELSVSLPAQNNKAIGGQCPQSIVSEVIETLEFNHATVWCHIALAIRTVHSRMT